MDDKLTFGAESRIQPEWPLREHGPEQRWAASTNKSDVLFKGKAFYPTSTPPPEASPMQPPVGHFLYVVQLPNLGKMDISTEVSFLENSLVIHKQSF